MIYCRICGISEPAHTGAHPFTPREAPVLTMTGESARPDTRRGLYQRYVVQRLDGSSVEGGKHHACRFYVLDASHDPFAAPALRAYAEACRAQYPALAHDLDALARFCDQRTQPQPAPDHA